MKYKQSKFLYLPTIIFAIIACDVFFHSCAQISQPIGGEKDTIAPVATRCIPDSFVTNFDSEKIFIEFNEFVKLKGIQQQLVVSPPLPEKPEIILKSKKIVVKLNNELQKNTTYTINFGDAIQDITENNPLESYQYVFSTGDAIDSLRLFGKVLDAFTHEPIKDCWVMLYQNFNDSTPINTIPDFIDKTDEQGKYSINNIKTGNYRIFALKDINSNLKFDISNEKIAFDTITYTPSANVQMVNDTIKVKRDSIMTDSVVLRQKLSYSPDSISLFLFEEDHLKLYLSSFERPERKKLEIAFSRETKSTTTLIPLNFTTNPKWFVPEINKKSDTLTYWLTDSVNYKQDTLRLAIQYYKPDSTNQLYMHTDTVMMRYSPKKKKKDKKSTRRKQKEKNTTQTDSIKNNYAEVNHNIKNDKFEPEQKIIFTSKYPIATIQSDSIKFYEYENDSIKNLIKYSIIKDSINPRKFILDFKAKNSKKYEFVFNSGAISDIYKNVNDSISKSFTVASADDYEKLTLEMKGFNLPVILQMFSGTTMKKELYVLKPQDVKFNYLKEGDYSFKLIIDKNKNKKWDTGNYIKGIQAEKVIFFPNTVKIIPNSENIITWDISKK